MTPEGQARRQVRGPRREQAQLLLFTCGQTGPQRGDTEGQLRVPALPAPLRP